jgi:uncharacterized membrane protein YdjX (TVP38/TMEM64 family)
LPALPGRGNDFQRNAEHGGFRIAHLRKKMISRERISASSSTRSTGIRPRTQFWILVLILIGLLLAGSFFHFDDTRWTEFFGKISFPVAGVLFVAAYIGITFFVWFAKDLLRIAGAVAFGPFWSTLFIWIAELVNAAIFFHLSRRLGRAYVEEKFNLKRGQLDRAGRSGGIWHIFLLRTLPVIPFRILDLAYGLSPVPFRRYLIVSAVAMPVRIFWVQFIAAALGSSIFNIAKAMAYFQQNIVVLELSFLYLIFSIAAVIFLRMRFK